MVNKFYSFVEGNEYFKGNIPNQFLIDSYFSKNSTGNLVAKISGLVFYNNNHYIFFPKGYDLVNTTSKEKMKTAKLLFQTIMKYKETVRLEEEQADWLGGKNKKANRFSLIDWLINDFLIHGLYIENETVLEDNGNGKIDWSKTIKTKLPIIKKNSMNNKKSFIFLDLITKKNMLNSGALITKIHENIIIDCMYNFGWLYNLNSSKKIVNIDIGISEQIIVLKRELKETNVTHDIKLLNSLIAFLEITIGDNYEYSIVTPYFYSIWETILREAFNHNSNLQSYVPKPYWNIQDEKKYTRQIPDILIEHVNSNSIKELVIIDAKYYSIVSGEAEKYPGWESIVKQLYYNISMEHLYSSIENIFLMPQTLRGGSPINYIGYAAVEGKEKEFKYVYSFSIDIDLALTSYVSNNKLENLLKELLNLASTIKKA